MIPRFIICFLLVMSLNSCQTRFPVNLLVDHSGGKTWIAPVGFGTDNRGQDYFSILPVFFWKEEAGVIIPFIFDSDRKGFNILPPLIGHRNATYSEKEFSWFLPFYYNGTVEGKTIKTIALPIYYHETNEFGNVHSYILGPFYVEKTNFIDSVHSKSSTPKIVTTKVMGAGFLYDFHETTYILVKDSNESLHKIKLALNQTKHQFVQRRSTTAIFYQKDFDIFKHYHSAVDLNDEEKIATLQYCQNPLILNSNFQSLMKKFGLPPRPSFDELETALLIEERETITPVKLKFSARKKSLDKPVTAK